MIEWNDVRDVIPGNSRKVILHAEWGNPNRVNTYKYDLLAPYKPNTDRGMEVEYTIPDKEGIHPEDRGMIVKCLVTHWAEFDPPT